MTASAVTTLRLVAGESEQAGWTLTNADGRALFRVGSDPDCNWQVVAPGVAPQQFLLLWSGCELAIIDVGAGPVRLDGRLLEGTAIVRSGRIQFGGAAMVVESAAGRGVVHEGTIESSGSTTAETLGPTTPRSSAPAHMSDVITVVAAGAGDLSHGTPIPSRSAQERPTERDLSVPVLETGPTAQAAPAARARAAAEGREADRVTASLPAPLALTRSSPRDAGATIPDAAPARLATQVCTATMGSPRVEVPAVLVGGRAAPAVPPHATVPPAHGTARPAHGTPRPAHGTPPSVSVDQAASPGRPSAPKVTVASPVGKPRRRSRAEPAIPLQATRVAGDVRPPAPPPPPEDAHGRSRRGSGRTWLLLGLTLAAGGASFALPALRAAPEAAPSAAPAAASDAVAGAAAAAGRDAGAPADDAAVTVASPGGALQPEAAEPSAPEPALLQVADTPPAAPLDLVDEDDPLATRHCARRRRCTPHTRERVAADLVVAGELDAAADRYAALAVDTGEERFATFADILRTSAGARCPDEDPCP